MNFQSFIDKTLGRRIDTDGVPKGQPYQCVDLAKYWNILYNPGFQITCTTTGYAKDWANNRRTNGILKYFKETAVNNMITGTLVVWGNCRVAPYSHIGFFIKDNGNGTFRCLQQNAPHPYVTISNISYEGIIGAFIPNQLVKKPTAPSKPSTNKPTSKGADQVLYSGSKVNLGGCQIKDIKTVNGKTTFYSDKYGTWLPIEPFYRIDEKGNRYPNQNSSKGNWIKSDGVYTVVSVSKRPDKAKVKIGNNIYNILSSGLYEVSNN